MPSKVQEKQRLGGLDAGEAEVQIYFTRKGKVSRLPCDL